MNNFKLGSTKIFLRKPFKYRQISLENSKPLQSFYLWRAIEIHLSSKDEDQRDITDSIIMTQGNLVFNSGLDLIFGSLGYFTIKREKYYYKVRSTFSSKMRQSSLQNASGFFFKKKTVSEICDCYYKMHQFCYKMRKLFQVVMFITECVGTFILN